MPKILLLVLTLTVFTMSCAAPPSPAPSPNTPIFELKALQAKVLLEPENSKRKANEAHYLQYADTLPEGVVLTNMFGDILEANPAYQKMLGYDLAELRNLSWQKITPAKWYEIDRQGTAEAMIRDYVTFKKEFLKKDGTFLSVDLVFWIIKDQRGDPIGIGSLAKPASK